MSISGEEKVILCPAFSATEEHQFMSVLLMAFVLQIPVYSVPETHQLVLIKFSLGGV